MNFDEKRELLLNECYKFKNIEDFKVSYERRFFDFIEDIILFLLQGEDSFFGQFLLKVKRNIRIDIEYPVGTIPKLDGFNMYFNPYLFLMIDKKEMAALLKHEIYHIINLHYQRAKTMKNVFCNEAITTALDISINQYIKNLPGFSKRLHSVNMEYNIELEENRSIEEYAEIIDKSIKSRLKEEKITSDKDKHEINMEESHELWDEINISEEDIKSLTEKTAISAYNDKIPDALKNIILSYNKAPEIPWQIVLKNMLPSVKYGYKRTITRRDRRQPERLDIRGRLPKNDTNVIVAIDISASMSDEDIEKILIEILAITNTTKNEVTIIECDNEIRAVYKLKNKNDIRKRSKDNGSTKFSPVFKYISDNNLRNVILIYFTDGVGEEELEVKPINKKTLWIISGDKELSLKNPYGDIKRINSDKIEVIEGNLGLQMVNEAIHDWAR